MALLLISHAAALAEPIFYSDGDRGWFYDVSANSTSAALHSVKGSPPLPPDPVGTFDFPDPSVTQHNGTYHAFGGNMVMSSLDLTTWSRRSLYLNNAVPAWAQANAQPGAPGAPVELDHGRGWVMFYQMPRKHCTSRVCSCVGVATAPEPSATFKPAAQPLVCALDEDGAIDANPRRLVDGRLALYWKTTGYNTLAKPSRLWVRELDASVGTRFASGSSAINLLNQTEQWEAQHGVGCAEAPALLQHDGRTLLYYSGGDWTAGLAGLPYSVGYAECKDAIRGPCTKVTTDANGGPWLGPEHNGAVGVGGQDFFSDVDGKPWMVFHGWRKGDAGYGHGGRRMVRFYPLSLLPPLRSA